VASTTGPHRAIVEVTRQAPPASRRRDGDGDGGDDSGGGGDADGAAGAQLERVDGEGGYTGATAGGRVRRLDDLPPPRRFTWRVAVFGGLFLLAILIAVFAVGFSARNTFYVGFEQDSVAIYRGRPGGVLWIDPTVEEVTDIRRDDLPTRLVRELDGGKDEDSLDSAQDYVDFLRTQLEDDPEPVGEAPP
jgi:hypothetical protein